MQVVDRAAVAHLALLSSADETSPLHTRSKRRPHTVGTTSTKTSKTMRISRFQQSRERALEASMMSSTSEFDRPMSSPLSFSQPQLKQPMKQMSKMDRRLTEICAKWEKTEAIRIRDARLIKDRAERHKENREDRFKRLLEEVTCRGDVAFESVMLLRAYEARQEERLRELHAEWDQNVFQPIARHAFKELNRPERGRAQTMAGRKSVDFELPGEKCRIIVDVVKDPCRRPLFDDAKEKQLQKAADELLGRSQSAPSLYTQHNLGYLNKKGSPCMIPKAVSRQTLEPVNWSQGAFQGTMYGTLAQAFESAPHSRRIVRGGPDVFVPDESDGVPVAGTRISRIWGPHDKGVLRGMSGSLGESYDYKTPDGSSSAAPVQDHYTFERGSRVTDLEFPAGKRTFPEFH